MARREVEPPDLPVVLRARADQHPGSSAPRGWWPLLEKLDAQLSKIDPDYRLHQVKQKWGLLRIYLADDTCSRVTGDALRSLLAACERHSGEVCERCGPWGGGTVVRPAESSRFATRALRLRVDDRSVQHGSHSSSASASTGRRKVACSSPDASSHERRSELTTATARSGPTCRPPDPGMIPPAGEAVAAL
jgi:hypothetical protein